MFARLKRVNSTGKGMILTFPTEPVTYPPYGTVLNTVNQDYTLGLTETIGTTTYYGQTGDYVTYADGFGGVLYGWNNIVYKTGVFASSSGDSYVDVYTDHGLVSAVSGNWSSDYEWDGYGGINQIGTGGGYAGWGNFITSDSSYHDTNYVFVDDGNGGGDYRYAATALTAYYHDGSGGYFTEDTNGSWKTGATGVLNYFMPDIPYGSGLKYANGIYCDVVWDGYGSFYIDYMNQHGSYYPNGTYIYTYASSPSQTYVTGNFGGLSFDNGITIEDWYVWDGMGGYNTQIGQMTGSYYPYGTWFTNDGSYDFYWDGSGGYYTI